jgi:hypothetical protein
MIWCTAFATFISDPYNPTAFADVVVYSEYTGPCGETQKWHERAATHADQVIDGYRDLQAKLKAEG